MRNEYISLLQDCLLGKIYNPIRLKTRKPATADEIEEGKFIPHQAHTMIGNKRLTNLKESIEIILRQQIDGDFLEAGVWRGGACIFMRGMLKAYGITNKKVYVADSFQGFRKPGEKDQQCKFHTSHFSFLRISEAEVRANFAKYNLLDDQVVFMPGFFEDGTLNNIPLLSLLRIDCDRYESTMLVLNTLYKKVNPNGFIIIDDYILKGCRTAVDEFRNNHRIKDKLEHIDWTGVFWRKTISVET